MGVLEIIGERASWFLQLIGQTLALSLISLALGCAIGLVLGIVVAEIKRGSAVILGAVNVLYTVPDIAMFGLLIPLTGIGDTTAIIAMTVYALLPMVKNTAAGLSNIDHSVIEAAKGMGSTRFQTLVKVKLPMALPVIMSGVRTTAVMTISVAGIASYIGAGGLGVAIYRGITTYNFSLMAAGSLLIALLAVLTDLVLGRVAKRVGSKWKTA